MSGRGGGRGRGSSTPGSRPKGGKVEALKRAPGRSPARGSTRQDSPSRGSPGARGRGRGRGASPRGSPASRGGKKSAEKPPAKVVPPPPSDEKVVVEEVNTRRRKKGPRINENPEAPEMEDMDGLRSSTGRRPDANGDLKTNGVHSPAEEQLEAGSTEVKTMISEMVSNLSTELLDRIGATDEEAKIPVPQVVVEGVPLDEKVAAEEAERKTATLLLGIKPFIISINIVQKMFIMQDSTKV